VDLDRALAAIRLHGVAVVSGQLNPAHAAVAAPVFGPGREIVAALEVRLRDASEQLRRVVPALLMAARGLSRELGHAALPGGDDSIRSGSIRSRPAVSGPVASGTVVSLDKGVTRRRREAVHDLAACGRQAGSRSRSGATRAAD
jgi:hypothetical protein